MTETKLEWPVDPNAPRTPPDPLENLGELPPYGSFFTLPKIDGWPPKPKPTWRDSLTERQRRILDCLFMYGNGA